MKQPTSSRPGGRPRDARIATDVTEATLRLLADGGYFAVNVGEVARAAQTSRPAIYRRWSGRPELVLAAIESRLDTPGPPDTGCTLCDIAESLTIFLAAYRTISPEVFGALYSECVADPALHQRYLEAVIEPSRKAVRAMLRSAVDRGDLRDDVDIKGMLDIIAAFVHYRALFGNHLEDADAERVIETVMRGAAVDYEALLAHSRAIDGDHVDQTGTHHVHLERPT
ncbi:TetR/AcrR family transcriptional regulator [Nocardia ignorata]|uniref:TetR family transcriptional regulator n=1 Tax=Nocardia ignorata TaxID=145285 RepID=A0A4R6P1I4_NOCIG|nr:TetR/AcrR family transcriptional regulator [Nocardia ignorata]TDP30823.1 TetR family transcriptional regulator [Nocardia ignorata]